MASPVRDGSNHGTASGTGGTAHTISVTCAAGATIVLMCQSDVTTSLSAYTQSMSADTSGIVWTHVGDTGLSAYPGTTTTYALLSVFVGTSAGALSGATVKMTSSSVVDSWTLEYSSYTGATGVDPNGALPVIANHAQAGGGQAVQNTGIATTKADDMIITCASSAFNSSFTLTAQNGSVAVAGGTSAGTWWAWGTIIDYSVSSTQSSLTQGATNSLNGWCCITFALTSDSLASGPPAYIMLLA